MSSYLNLKDKPSYENIRCYRRQLQSVLLNIKVDAELQNKILLCFSEVATNFVEHTVDSQQLTLKLIVFRSCLALSVGTIAHKKNIEELRVWLEDRETEDIQTIDELECFRTGGRGGFLVKSLCDSIDIPQARRYKIDDKVLWKNKVVMHWDFDGSNIKPHILIVDDDRSLNTLYGAYLAQNYVVLSAYSAEQAIEIIQEQHVDLIVSDMNMPRKSGLDLREFVKQNYTTADLPFIVTSAYGTSGIDECKRIGIDDFLPKPVDKTTLLECASRVLARNQQLKRDIPKKIYDRIRCSLQPQLPEKLGSWRFAVEYEPSDFGGGDLVMWHRYSDQTLLIIADIMGHDEVAKFFAYAYRGYIRGLLSATSTIIQPAQFLDTLSLAMQQDQLLGNSLCTCCAILLDDSGTIEVSSAGHPPAFKVSSKHVQVIASGGVLPGLHSEIDYTSSQCVVTQGERLMMFTDGLFDEQYDKTHSINLATQQSFVHKSIQNSLDEPIDIAAKIAFESARNIQSNKVDDAILILAEFVAT